VSVPKKVFISYQSEDRPAAEALAHALHEAGIEAWWDRWEIRAGSDFVATINQGLDECDAGLVLLSGSTRDSAWVKAELSYLTYARVSEAKPLIPIALGADVFIPPLLRPLDRRAIDDVDGIVAAILDRCGKPQVKSRPDSRVRRAVISLAGCGTEGVRVTVSLDGTEYASAELEQVPAEVIQGTAAFRSGFRGSLLRNPADEERRSREQEIAELGRALGALCLPGDSGAALADLIDGCALGTMVEVVFTADRSDLLGLPLEALRLPDGRLLAVQPKVVTYRRPAGTAAKPAEPLAGPLKILVAVGAPDESKTASAVLDLEHELQNILDAVEEPGRLENVQVRILEIGHPKEIRRAFEADAYHVLHLSCHGGPGILELEDQDGHPVTVSAKELLEPLQASGRQAPLVFLNACHTGSEADATPSLAEALLKAGSPAVLAMQTAVSDRYGSELSRRFYEHLARSQPPRPGRALALARKELETERQAALQRPSSPGETLPEYATAALYTTGEDVPLVDFAADKAELLQRPVYQVAGPVPQLRMDDLIGRRREVREALKALRGHEFKGVVLTGIGGVGKSAVAGRIMQRLAEDKRVVAAHAGKWDFAGVVAAVAAALIQDSRPQLRQRGEALQRTDLDDRVRFQLLAGSLAEDPLLLVLDDFEQNLSHGGSGYLDPDAKTWIEALLQHTGTGRVLITCRYPVPGTKGVLKDVPLGPLSRAETRKLLQRLPMLRNVDPAELERALRALGRHPQMLELLDGLLNGGEGRLPHVTQKLEKLLRDEDEDAADLDAGVRQTVLLGARDIFLDELLEIARAKGVEELLLQCAVSSLPVSADGLAHMLADEPPSPAAVRQTARGLKALAGLSLVHVDSNGFALVHRWTAEGLAARTDLAAHRERCARAGRYRWWRVENESHALDDGMEGVRNFLDGEAFQEASETAYQCIQALQRFNQTLSVAALAGEVLLRLPETHPNFAALTDAEASAHLALGFANRALERYEALLAGYEVLTAAEPDRAVYQQNLATLHERVGDLHRALGQGDRVREAYERSLRIRERLSATEPDRADYQRNLAISYERVGDLYRSSGQAELAQRAYEESLARWTTLCLREPNRLDYQKGLCVPLVRLGDMYRALGQSNRAREYYLRDLEIAEQLVAAEPERADYQRDLSYSYNKVTGLYFTLGQWELARKYCLKDLEIAERLAAAEPDRADYQHDLSISYNKIGDLHRVLGQEDHARDAYERSLHIRERLAAAEPDRADYQHDLSISYNKIGDLCSALGQDDQARDAYERCLIILEQLAAAEPERTDYQYNLSSSYQRIGHACQNAGDKAEAYGKSVAVMERLAAAEPGRADLQLGLMSSLASAGVATGDRGRIEQALGILRILDGEGRLPPAEQPKIAILESMLAKMPQAEALGNNV